MINNLGGLSVLELNVIAEEVTQQLLNTGFDIRRMLVGTFVTSLDGPGFSVTVLKLQPDFENLLNAKTAAPAWPNLVEPIGHVNGVTERMVAKVDDSVREEGEVLLPIAPALLREILRNVLNKVTEDEPLITKYDTIAGDGDCGETLLKGAEGMHSPIIRMEKIQST